MLKAEIHIGRDGRVWTAEILTTVEVQQRTRESGKTLPRRASGADKWNIIARGFTQEECAQHCAAWLEKYLPGSVAMLKTF
ncbi:MAG TPA: hypothetical protein VF681_05825 [Abditibacteriaceae bacterium]|jgi:hypothetical protein